MPVVLAQIQAISKYRSCAGHDHAGYDFSGTLETNRSMKHYLLPIAELQGTLDKVKAFAPFDGTVVRLEMEKDTVGGRPHNGNGISFSTARDPNVQFQFGHVYFARDFKMGDAVKAGELIGFAALGETANDFDIDLFGQTPTGREVIYGSVFEHMTPTVLAAFAAVGVTPANVELTKADRDARPCDFAAGNGRPDADWVTLKQQ